MGPFGHTYARLVDRGYAVLPIAPGTKKPGLPRNGNWTDFPGWTTFRASNGQHEHWAQSDAGIGVLCGPPSGDLVAIDIDTDDSGIADALRRVLPATPAKKKGARGETWFYHGPEIPSRAWVIDGRKAVEILGPGRQTVLPPTIHPDLQRPYRWTGSETLEDIRPQDLPALPIKVIEWIDAALTPFGYEVPEPREPGDADTPHRQLNEAALANLGAWVPALKLYRCRATRHGFEAVPIWRLSSTGRDKPKRGRNLKISPGGIRDFGVDRGFTPIDLVMMALDCDLDAAFAFLSERLGWSSGDVSIAIPELATATGEPAMPAGEQRRTADAPADDPLEPLTHVPGLLGDIVDFIVGTARRPSRVLALGAAVTVIGTLIGRRAAGPTGSATHLYIVTIGPVASGKDHPRRCIPLLLEAAGAGTHVHLGDVASQTGFNRVITNMPLGVVVIDEIAGFLRRIASPRASEWERRLVGMLCTLWGSSFVRFGTMTSAQTAGHDVYSPAVSLFGTATNVEFWPVLQGAEVSNGLFSRFLVFENTMRLPDRDPPTVFEVPPDLKARLAELYQFGGGPLATAQLNDPNTVFRPCVLPWANTEARDIYQQLCRWVDCEIDNDVSKQEYLGRLAETALRLATIRAAGRAGNQAMLDADDMAWGADVASMVITGMMNRSRDCFVPTVRGEFAEKLVDFIVRRGSVTRREVQQHIRGRYNTREVVDILSQSIEGGFIVKTANGYAAPGKT
jgi:hypothetical protein